MEEAFRLWVPLDPLAKSQGALPDYARPLMGLASTDDPDQQGETIDQLGIDYEPLLRYGFINWDHRPGPAWLIGEPLAVEVVELPRGRRGLYFKGFLYDDDERKPEAGRAWAHLQLAAEGRARPLGFSVEGAVVAREGARIRKSVLRHLALTHQPVNPYTLAQLAKGQAPACPTLALGAGPSACPAGCHDARGRYAGATAAARRATALRHLVLCQGFAPAAAREALLRLCRSGLLS